MNLSLKRVANTHFKKYLFLYLLVIIFLMIGISSGAITLRVVDKNTRIQIIDFLNTFFNIINKDTSLSILNILKFSIINNLKIIIVIWLLGLTIIGIPVVFIIIAFRGFVIGFTVAFFIKELKFKGLIMALLCILPQNIFLITGLVIISVISILFSIAILKNKTNAAKQPSFLNRFINYIITVIIVSVIVIIGCFIEIFTTPILTKIINSYLTVFIDVI